MTQPAKAQEPSMEESSSLHPQNHCRRRLSQEPAPVQWRGVAATDTSGAKRATASGDRSAGVATPARPPHRLVQPPRHRPRVRLQPPCRLPIQSCGSRKRMRCSRSGAGPAPVAVDEPAADVLDLTEAMAAPAPAPGFPAPSTVGSDLVFEDRSAEHEHEPEASAAAAARTRTGPAGNPPGSRPLVDLGNHQRGGRFGFQHSCPTVLIQNGRTLEDLVREMLRPMLKSWLDDNCPVWSSVWCEPRSNASRAEGDDG